MNDREGFVNPKRKDYKCWDYDISNGAKPGNQLYNTPIGGDAMNFRLDKNYEISWSKFGEFWFSEIQALAPDEQ